MSIIVNEVVTDVSLNVTETISTFTIQINDGAVPIGGTTGQVLVKKTDGDYDTEWVDQSGGSTPDATPTVKGIAKLYDSLGANTDGSVDQNTITSELSIKGNMFKSENLSGLTDYVAARRNLDVYDEMVSFVACDFLGTTTGVISPFFITALLSGTSSLRTSELNHPGIYDIQSVATINSGFVYRLSDNIALLKGDERGVDIFKVQSNTDTVIRGGFHDSISVADPVDGVFYEITNGAVVFRTMNNSLNTNSSTITTLTVGNWYKFITRVISSSLVTLEIYDGTNSLLFSTNIVTNIPTVFPRTTGRAFGAWRTTATAGRILDLDYIDVTLNGLVR